MFIESFLWLLSFFYPQGPLGYKGEFGSPGEKGDEVRWAKKYVPIGIDLT